MAETLDLKTRELAGLAAAVAGHCRPCFTYHYKEAQAAGATPEEIRAVVELARAIRSAGDRQIDEFVAHRLSDAIAAASMEGGSDADA